MATSTTFTDTAGRKWTIRVTIGALRRIRERTGLRYPEIVDRATAAVFDPVTSVELLKIFLAEQFHHAGITEEEWEDSLDASLLSTISMALFQGVLDFFPSSEARDNLRAAVAAQMANLAQAPFQAVKASTPSPEPSVS